MKSAHTPIPRYRAFAGPALFKQGFRPFFLAAALWAPVALLLSLGHIVGLFELPLAYAAVAWHVHELIFGFVAAAVAGFMLTAIPNWTGRLPLQGGPLAVLVALWLVGRIGMIGSGVFGLGVAAAADLAFLAALLAAVAREIYAGRNWRNAPMIAAVAALLLCNGLFHAQALEFIDGDGLSHRLALAILVTLIALIGGRIIPSFTRNWLAKRNATRLPVAMNRFDGLTLVVTGVAAVAWAAAPESRIVGTVLALAAVLNLLRWLRWQGYQAMEEPLLWVLHLAYLWIPVSFAFLALDAGWSAVPRAAGVHALSVGAISTMILAVSSRATLGHTGRDLHAGAGLTFAYLAMTVAAMARIAAVFLADHYLVLLSISGAAWMCAFGAFLAVCGPMLVTATGTQSASPQAPNAQNG